MKQWTTNLSKTFLLILNSRNHKAKVDFHYYGLISSIIRRNGHGNILLKIVFLYVFSSLLFSVTLRKSLSSVQFQTRDLSRPVYIALLFILQVVLNSLQDTNYLKLLFGLPANPANLV